MNSRFLKLLVFAVAALLSIVAASAQTSTISTVVGNGYQGNFGIGGKAVKAELFSPISVAFDTAGNLYIADLASEYIYEVDASKGKISIFAGTGAGGKSGGGLASAARFNHPFGIAFGPSGDLYIADSNNNVVRKINMKNGKITTVAGNGNGAGPGDVDICGTTVTGVKATQTPICNPSAVAVDSAENLYLSSGSQILEVTASTGILTVVAGNGNYGYSGDGGPAVNASLSWLFGMTLDVQGNIYVSDVANCAIREITAATGIITSLVGTPSNGSGTCGFAGDGGPASAALVNGPFGVYVDSSGNVLFADSNNERIRMIASNGNIYTVAGNGKYGYSGDGGPAVNATFALPGGVTLDSAGNLYVTDGQNFVVREVTNAAAPPTVAAKQVPR
jgi:trimeric autotransporter adhesin